MKINVFNDEYMKTAGFSDHVEDKWTFLKEVAPEVSFILSINKDHSKWSIDVIDDDFGQPYDYQYILSDDSEHVFANSVKRNVESIMSYLCDIGIVSDYKIGYYI